MKLYKAQKNTGFTLIELIVVISLITLLSSVILASLNSARDKAKTRAFASNMLSFQTALELYKTDTGYYPYELTSSMVGGITSTSDNMTSRLSAPAISPAFIPTYLPSLPKFSEFPAGVNGLNFLNPDEYDTYSVPYPSGDQPYKCGGKTITGYLIYTGGSYTTGVLPLLTKSGRNAQTQGYCITGN